MPGKNIGEALRGFLRSFVKIDVPMSERAEENIRKLSQFAADVKEINTRYQAIAERAVASQEETMQVSKELLAQIQYPHIYEDFEEMPNYIA